MSCYVTTGTDLPITVLKDLILMFKVLEMHFLDLRYHCLNQLNKSDLTIEVRNLLEAGLYITNLAGSGNADTMWLFQILQVTFQLISNY